MRIIPILFLSLFYFLFTQAQPGPCYGIRIGGIYKKEVRLLGINDPVLRREFILNGSQIVREIYHNRPYGHFYHAKFEMKNSDRRFLLFQGSDTMMVDFVGWESDYLCDYIDSLVFMPGYFVYKRSRKDVQASVETLLRHGLTPYSISLLKPMHFIEYKRKPDLSFLELGNLPASFFLKRARAMIQDSNYDGALADIKTALGKKAEKDCEVHLLLCDALMGKADYIQALEEINQTADCENIRWTAQNFRLRRIDVYTGLKRYNDALHEYDTLMDPDRHRPLFYYSEKEMYLLRMRYRIKYIKDNKAIIKELEEVCASGTYGFYTGDLYFELAELQFRLRDEQNAYKNWVKAFDKMGLDHRRYESYAVFDSLVKKHPEQAELYYLRAVSSPAVTQGPYNSTLPGINAALSDLDMAEKLGLKTDMFDMFKANFLEIKRLTIAGEKWKAENGR